MKALAFLVAAVVAAGSQTSSASAAGSWTAQFQGRTFIRLELKTTGRTLSGGISLGDFEVDKAGALTKAAEAPRDLKPIADVRQSGSTVTFAVKDIDETDHFELRVIDASHAELKLVLSAEALKELAADGIPAPKPIALTKP